MAEKASAISPEMVVVRRFLVPRARIPLLSVRASFACGRLVISPRGGGMVPHTVGYASEGGGMASEGYFRVEAWACFSGFVSVGAS